MEKPNHTKLLIFVPETNPRVEFTFEFILQTILGVEVVFTSEPGEFLHADLPKINYSQSDFSSGLFLKAHSILFEKNISEQAVSEVEHAENLYFFPTSDDSFLPFDPFACTFYLLTRYEEYLQEITDEHGRFTDSENLLVRRKLHHKPIVDRMAYLIAEKISEVFPEFKIQKRPFKFLTTIDIDNAWAFKNKRIHILLGAILRSALHGHFDELKHRLAVFLGLQPDPYDSYKYILEIYKEHPDRLIFFLLLGDRSRYDKNISHKNKKYKQLIADLSAGCPIGIHPSYASNNKLWLFEKEKERLEKIVHKPITQSRQHYLKLRFPQTYQNLQKAGITDDFTMGFASLTGFRAGTCTPFPFFDLSRNVRTDLMIHPFQVMDVTLKNYLHLKPDEACRLISELMQEVKQVNGTFTSLWHNESLKNSRQWAGWQKVFEQLTETGLKYENEQS